MPADDLTYLYDPIGNRSQATIGQGLAKVYTPNNLSQYVSTANPTETFVYDGDGNMTLDGSFAYTWDAENRLIKVAPAASPVAGDKKLTFTYDYRGRRVRRAVQACVRRNLSAGIGAVATRVRHDNGPTRLRAVQRLILVAE